MAKVHPKEIIPEQPTPPAAPGGAAVLTVWRKSLLFNCSGFTVFDAKGNLAFRVDNYASDPRGRGEVLLMDAAGKPLLTIRRKRLSLGAHWLVYQGEEAANPRLSVRKQAGLLRRGALARATPCQAAGGRQPRGFEVEGSYSERCCAVYDGGRRRLAEIRRKEEVGGVGFGGEVFRLVVEPDFEASVAMAVVILLDQMFGSGR